MLHLSASACTSQPVLVLRFSERSASTAHYTEGLADHGLDLVECPSLEAAEDIISAGCRVGLLLVTDERDLAHLDRCEAVVSGSRICWVALVAQELTVKPRMREFIAEHLFNFITLPADLDHIALTLRHAWGMAFMREVQQRPSSISVDAESGFGMVGSSKQMDVLRNDILKIARTDAPLLIFGPTGSGKELAALAIHRQSGRSEAPFVAVNCGAIPVQRLEAELFGSDAQKSGHIEAASRGTLFLDAVDELPIDVQASLLRLLNEKTVERTGSDQAIEVDVRVMAATQVDLAEAVRRGQFREDLYYRLNVMCLMTPRLADRGQDIEAIARHYFDTFASTHNRSLRGFSKAAMNAMLAHVWPGNVRELINRVQRATAMAEGRFIQPEDLGLERKLDHPQLMSLEAARASAERVLIRRALAQSRNQISRAASLLGVSRVTLYRLIEKYNIRSEDASAIRAPLRSVARVDADARE